MAITDINVLLHQTPGGMLSNLVNQLRQMDALDRIDEVYKELPRVRKDLGQIPLVTPTSQIVGIQTVNNVLFDDENDGETPPGARSRQYRLCRHHFEEGLSSSVSELGHDSQPSQFL